MAASLLNLVEEFQKDHPYFLGLKIILAIPRNSDQTSLEQKMQRFVDLRNKYPNFVIGFDLVGQEDIGKKKLFQCWKYLYCRNVRLFFLL